MKSLLLIAIIVTLAVCSSCGQNKTAPKKGVPPSSKKESKANPYTDLRNAAFNVSAAQLGFKVSEKEVYEVILDCNIPEGIITFVAFKSGDASVYLSNGTAYIGGISIQKVANAAKALVNESQPYLPKATISKDKPLPGSNAAHFYLVTKKGIFSKELKKEEIESGTSEWLLLFQSAFNIITEFQNATEKK